MGINHYSFVRCVCEHVCASERDRKREYFEQRKGGGAQILTEECVALNGISSSINMTVLMN